MLVAEVQGFARYDLVSPSHSELDGCEEAKAKEKLENQDKVKEDPMICMPFFKHSIA